jgi:hypothetical protein
MDVIGPLEKVKSLETASQEDHLRVPRSGTGIALLEPEHVHVELLGALRVRHVKHHVIDPAYLEL